MSNLVPVSARSQTFRADIQGIRAVAIILVIALHLGVPGFSAGFIGVDVFFTVSGYVITVSFLKKTETKFLKNIADFWRSRFLRLFPLASLVICTTVIASYFLSGKAFNDSIFTDAKWATFYATNFRLINVGSNYFVAGLDQSLFTHFWALAVEQQFYLIFPIVVFAITKISSPKARTLVLRLALGLVVIASSIWSVLQTSMDPVASYFSPFTRFWELAFGALLATFQIRENWVLSFLGLGTLLGCMFLLGPTTSYPGYLAWLPVIGTGLILLYPIRQLGFGPLRYIGDISYALYLWHFVWLVLPNQIENPPVGDYWNYLYLLGAVLSAVISYHFFERPIHRSISLKADWLSTVILGAVCILTAWTVIELVENLYLRSIL